VFGKPETQDKENTQAKTWVFFRSITTTRREQRVAALAALSDRCLDRRAALMDLGPVLAVSKVLDQQLVHRPVARR